MLYDNQIDYDIIPPDVFTERDAYRTEIGGGTLKVNTQEYRALAVPKARHLPEGMEAVIEELRAAGVRVYLGLDGLDTAALRDVEIEPANDRVRIYRYEHTDGSAVIMLVNEGDKPYTGSLTLSDGRNAYGYDAWENAVRPLETERAGERLTVKLELVPLKSAIIVLDSEAVPEGAVPAARTEGAEVPFLGPWRRSVCAGIDYPEFSGEKEVALPDDLAGEQPEFSGFVRYENSFEGRSGAKLTLLITDAYEGVEAFINGESLGIQIAPPFVYDVSGAVRDGMNSLRIEVATTLEREMAARGDGPQFLPGGTEKPSGPSGINGVVRLLKT